MLEFNPVFDCSFFHIKIGNEMETANKSIIVTNCTGRKLQNPEVSLPENPFHYRTVDDIAQAWKAALSAVPPRHIARQLYAGRAFREAEVAAAGLDGQLYVVSAGLGLVSADDTIPAYDLTVGTSGATVLPALKRLGLGPKHWWKALNRGLGKSSPIADLLDRHPQAVVYLAMPSTYLALIGEELSTLSPLERTRLRIFSSPAWLRHASTDFARFVLPYDERLESTPFSGTKNDFPQRALRHFVESLKAHTMDLDKARIAVDAAMSKQFVRTLPERQKRSDDEIQALLRLHWQANEGSSSRLLRVLRDNLLVKCEQSRFKDLWRSVRDEMESNRP